jgi:hypothetical protein
MISLDSSWVDHWPQPLESGRADGRLLCREPGPVRERGGAAAATQRGARSQTGSQRGVPLAVPVLRGASPARRTCLHHTDGRSGSGASARSDGSVLRQRVSVFGRRRSDLRRGVRRHRPGSGRCRACVVSCGQRRGPRPDLAGWARRCLCGRRGDGCLSTVRCPSVVASPHGHGLEVLRHGFPAGALVTFSGDGSPRSVAEFVPQA